jgi:phosphopantothenoylcysteine decarboxylase
MALKEEVPKLIAPAMNTYMYQNPVNQRNLNWLREVGYKEIDPREALLACGDFGKGALANIPDILDEVTQALHESKE